jgi:hypothetical protein
MEATIMTEFVLIIMVFGGFLWAYEWLTSDPRCVWCGKSIDKAECNLCGPCTDELYGEEEKEWNEYLAPRD